MNKEEAKKILENNTSGYYEASDEVLEALDFFDNDGEITLEGWSAFYKNQDYTFYACIFGPSDDPCGNYFSIPVWTDSDENEALAQELFCEAGCAAQMEFMFEMLGEGLTEDIVKERIEAVCNKYGFKIVWEDPKEHPELDTWN